MMLSKGQLNYEGTVSLDGEAFKATGLAIGIVVGYDC